MQLEHLAEDKNYYPPVLNFSPLIIIFGLFPIPISSGLFFKYSVILSVIWGIVIWNEWLSLISLLGIMLILLSGIYIAVREVEVGVKPSAKRASGRR